MALKFACSLLLLSTLMVCQSQDHKPSSTSAQVSLESGAQAQQLGQSIQEPLQEPLQEKAAANGQIQSNLQSALDDDPLLSEANIGMTVDDENITLTGTAQSYWQHQRVLQLVSPYSRSRKIVDKMSVQ